MSGILQELTKSTSTNEVFSFEELKGTNKAKFIKVKAKGRTDKELQHNKIVAAGLSRIFYNMQGNAWGTISAFRKYRREAFKLFKGEIEALIKKNANGSYGMNEALDDIPEAKPYYISNAENMQRHRKLMLTINNRLNPANSSAIISIMGQYKEGSGKPRKEQSAFVFYENPDKLKKILIEVGEEFEQDTINFCPEQGSRIQGIATSPKDINSKGVNPGTLIETFSGVRWGTLEYTEKGKDGTIEKKIQDIFSKVNGRPFWWLDWQPVMENNPEGVEAMQVLDCIVATKKAYTRISPDYEGIQPYGNASQYYRAKSRIQSIADTGITTAGNIFRKQVEQNGWEWIKNG